MRSRMHSLVCLMAALAMAGAAWGAGTRCQARRPAPGAWPVCHDDADAGRALRAFRVAPAVRQETQTNVVDILLVFDESARRWLAASGKGTSFTYAQACVRVMNGVLERSRMDAAFRFRLAGAVDLAADLSSRQTDMEDLLDLFVDGWGHVVAEGALAKVSDRREAVGADIVSILTARGGFGTVGVGYSLEDETGWNRFGLTASQIVAFGDWAYNVCSIEAVDDDYTLLHEIGHNMGAGHPDAFCADGRAISLGPQLRPYSAGYYAWCGGIGYYTVMAYNFGGIFPDGSSDLAYRFEPLPCFSSPVLSHGGVPLGTERNDNRRTLLETCAYVAQYRASRLPVGSTGVSSAENARAEAEWNAGASSGVDVPAGTVSAAGFTVEGPFNPPRALNGVFPYVGGVYSNGVAVGVIQLKVGKANARKGTCQVSGTVALQDGKRYNLAKTVVSTGSGPRRAADVKVKSLGTFSGWLGGNGFAGTMTGTPYGALEVRTTALDGRLDGSAAHFSLSASEEALSAAAAGRILMDCLPTDEPVAVSASGSWSCRRAATISYKSAKDPVNGMKSWMLSGLDDPRKPNRAGLRLTCTPKKATFKGSFYIYFDVGTSERPRLKKMKATVTGIVVDGEGRGIATVKGGTPWPVLVR